METVVVSPLCSGKRFWGLEKGAGWVADWGRVRSGGQQVAVVLWRVTYLPGWPLAVVPRNGKL